MKRIIRLTESDLTRIVRRVIMEQDTTVYLIDGESWNHVGTDTMAYQGKKGDVEMKHIPRQGQNALANKTWTVACNGSVTPKPTSGSDKLIKIASRSLTC